VKRIGLTGGIGSGKSTVARIFSQLGIPIYYADERGKYLLVHDLELKEAVKRAFGEAIYPNDALDAKALGAVVFNDPECLTALNALVHPAVRRDYIAWCEATQGEAEYSIKEAAILFETGGQREMDATIVVTAPEPLRIERVMQRDGVGAAAVQSRLDRQWPEGDKVALADYIIVNDGDHSLIEQVKALDAEIQAELL
jgi:dephospho-CoA kinase